ncbi:efflux RND transporter periplasmic adaptor subunit [Planctomicrobium sp. SH527]|uniref:efflux RND transporter periplasmic adaptor subunit n=1 Tax=Planctomicrobium sp. SH527 TaxID=3448123 RepID=UPI003F5AFC7A
MKILLELIRLVLPVAIVAGGVVAYSAISSQKKDPEKTEIKDVIPLVETVPVTVHPHSLDIQLDGSVVPHREITMSAEVAGMVTMKAPECRAGRFVKAGTLLVEIDSRDYRLEVERLTEEVKQGDAALQELDVDLQNVDALLDIAHEETLLRQRELRRILALHQQSASSETAVDEARRMEMSARNSTLSLQNQSRKLEASRARLQSARSLSATKLKQAELNVEKASIRAPIDGVIVTESVEQNSFVQPGTSLFAIDDTSAAEVRCSLRMEELEWVLRQAPAAGTPSSGNEISANDALSHSLDYELPLTQATVTYRSKLGDVRWEGKLIRFEGIGLDERTRTVPCRILVENPREKIKSVSDTEYAGPRALVRGMFVRVVLHTNPGQTLLSIPEVAVQPGNQVYCVRDDKLKIVALKEISLTDGHVLTPVKPEGLQEGDEVVITPLVAPLDGMSIRVDKAASASKVAGR